VVAPRIGEFHPTLGLRFPPLTKTHVLAIRLMENAGWLKIDCYMDEAKISPITTPASIPGGCWNPDALRADKHARSSCATCTPPASPPAPSATGSG
jgi:protease I